MPQFNLFSYLLRNVKYKEETPGEVTCLFPQREYDDVGFDIGDLPSELPFLEGAKCVRRWLGKDRYIWQHDESDESGYHGAKISRPYVEYLKSKTICIDHNDFRRTGISNVRWPFFMVRGRSIDHEQMKYLLKNEFAMFRVKTFFGQAPGDCAEENGHQIYCGLHTRHFGNLIPDRDGSSGGWLWDTGEIGGHGWEDKYPEFTEYMPRWLDAALNYPFLDMVVGYTLYAETPCYTCPLKCYYENLRFLNDSIEAGDSPKEIRHLEDDINEYKRLIDNDVPEYPNKDMDRFHVFICRKHQVQECEAFFRKDTGRYFVNGAFTERVSLGTEYADIVYAPELARDVVMTVRIHDGTLDVFTGVEASLVFQEYDVKFGFKETWRYATGNIRYFHDLLKETLVTEDTLRECFEEEGMNADYCIDYLVKKYGMELDLMQRGTPRIS